MARLRSFSFWWQDYLVLFLKSQPGAVFGKFIKVLKINLPYQCEGPHSMPSFKQQVYKVGDMPLSRRTFNFNAFSLAPIHALSLTLPSLRPSPTHSLPLQLPNPWTHLHRQTKCRAESS